MLFDNLQNKQIQKGKQESQFNTETMLPISEIKDGYCILKDGGIRAILRTDGINLDLKNFDEIQTILEQYKRFLNGLEFPQYVSRNIDQLDPWALKQQGQSYLSFLEDINMKQGLIFVKEFYVVVPYYVNEQDTDQIKKPWRSKFMDTLNAKDDVETIVSRYRNFVKGQKMLNTRIALIQEGLAGLGIRTTQLNTKDVISLLFSVYNPLLDSTQAQREEK